MNTPAEVNFAEVNFKELLTRVIAGAHLTREESRGAMSAIMAGSVTPAQIAAFLVAHKLKGETYQEVAGFAEAMRERATRVRTQHPDAIDMCGTGGDGKGTFNVSTVASFVVAACGVPVAKHGNRSVSSRCGSADLLEALGVHITLDAEQIGQCLDELLIGFLYAPGLHQAMRHAVNPRREIGVRTVFNMLGPITNPASVRRQLLGVFNLDSARLMAEVLRDLGADHVLVLHSEDGLDEISIYAPTTAFEVRGQTIDEINIQPEELGIEKPSQSGASGGTPEENAQLTLAVLAGKEKTAAREFVIANAAGGIYVGGKAPDLASAARKAREAIDSGAALAKFESFRAMTQRWSK